MRFIRIINKNNHRHAVQVTKINKRIRDKQNKEIVTNKDVDRITTVPSTSRVQQNEQCKRRYDEKKDGVKSL